MAPGDQSTRVIRGRDRGLLRAMGATLLISACLVGGVLGIVGLRVNQVKLSYRLPPLPATPGGGRGGDRHVAARRGAPRPPGGGVRAYREPKNAPPARWFGRCIFWGGGWRGGGEPPPLRA